MRLVADLVRPQVVEAFLKLNKPYQNAIADVTKKMGAGMAEFIEKEARGRRQNPLCTRAFCSRHRYRSSRSTITTSTVTTWRALWASACRASLLRAVSGVLGLLLHFVSASRSTTLRP